MNKLFLVLFVVSFIFIGGVNTVNAQTDTILPPAGISPSSPFYFLDRLIERMQEILTTNPEAKARLQIKFAGERISEIKYLVDNGGAEIENKNIEKAKKLLLANVAEAATIIQGQKNKGKDVAQLANDINTSFNSQEQLLIQTFQDARKKLNRDRNTLLAKKGVPVIDDTKKITTDSLTQNYIDIKINDLSIESDNLKNIQNDIDSLFTNEQTKIVDILSPNDKKENDKESIKNKKENETENSEIEDDEHNSLNEDKEIETESEDNSGEDDYEGGENGFDD